MAKKSDRPRDLANDIIGLVREGTKKWTKTRRAEERSPAWRATSPMVSFGSFTVVALPS